MFGLFKKKEKPEEKPQINDAQGEELRAFAVDFLPEEGEYLAVTGSSGFDCVKEPGQVMWTVGSLLTAWMEKDGEQIHRQEVQLVTKADDLLMGYLRQRLPRDFILKFRARPSQDGTRFLLTNLPEPAFDPDLKAILEEQKAPVTVESEALGAFTLNRSMNLFQAEGEWLEQPVFLAFEEGQDAAGCFASLNALLADQAGWDGRLRAFVSQSLLDRVNELLRETDGEAEEAAAEELSDSLAADMLCARADGSFVFWYNTDLLWGNSIRVSGTLENGPTEAQMEG